MGCFKNNLITVPIYDTLGQKAIEHVINEAELSIIVCTDDKAQFLLNILDKLPTLKTIVVMDAISQDTTNLSSTLAGAVKLMTVKDIEDMGEKDPHEQEHKPTANEVATKASNGAGLHWTTQGRKK